MTLQQATWPVKETSEIIVWKGRASADSEEYVRAAKESERPLEKEKIEAVMAEFTALSLPV